MLSYYIKLFKQYNELYDIYEKCDESIDYDVIEDLEPKIEIVLEEILIIEKELIKMGQIILPPDRIKSERNRLTLLN